MKSKTPSFVLELPLNTNSVQESTILVRLEAGRQLYNACLGEALKRLDLLRQSKEFQETRKLPRGKGKNQFDTLEGQNNETGLIFKENTHILSWSGLEIPCMVDEKNELISYGLQHRVKYCRLVRRKINGKNRFYVQLILEGKPYQDPEREFGKEELGMDVGPNTYAVVGDTKAEKIPYKSWQKIWGKSVSIRAPSMFMSGLKRKAENAGGGLYLFPTQSTKLSQYCHLCEKYVKKPLPQRWHMCCGIDMQRDLYSAFLAKCVDVTTVSLDTARARMLWPGLEPVLREAVSRAYQSASGRTVPASFGVGNRRQSGSPVKHKVTVTEAADAVVRDIFYEDESRREVA